MRSSWLPLLVSLALHGVFALLGWALFSAGFPSAAAPLPVRACVLVPDSKLTLTLIEPTGPRRPSGAEKSPAESTAARPVVISIPVQPDGPGTTVPAVAGIGPGETSEPNSGPSGQGLVGTGNGAATSFFNVPVQGRSVVYVIDRSLSMGPTGALDAAKFELLTSLHQLPDGSRFQVIFYNGSAEPLYFDRRGQLLPASPEVKEQLTAYVNSLLAEGKTNHVRAVQRALELEPDLIILVTDADELSPEQVAALTRQNRRRTMIHAIELTTTKQRGDGPLRRLAENNQGTYQALLLRPR
jgi:hypothetical protein